MNTGDEVWAVQLSLTHECYVVIYRGILTLENVPDKFCLVDNCLVLLSDIYATQEEATDAADKKVLDLLKSLMSKYKALVSVYSADEWLVGANNLIYKYGV
jgi:hypothetical protein